MVGVERPLVVQSEGAARQERKQANYINTSTAETPRSARTRSGGRGDGSELKGGVKSQAGVGV